MPAKKIGTPIRPVKKKLEFLSPSVCGMPPREKKKKNGSKPKKKAFFSAHPEGGRVHWANGEVGGRNAGCIGPSSPAQPHSPTEPVQWPAMVLQWAKIGGSMGWLGPPFRPPIAVRSFGWPVGGSIARPSPPFTPRPAPPLAMHWQCGSMGRSPTHFVAHPSLPT